MNKIYPCLVSICLLFFSCTSGLDNTIPTNAPEGNTSNTRCVLDVKSRSYFSGDIQYSFPECTDGLYLNYMPDTLHTTAWLKLAKSTDTLYKVSVIWSENIREIGASGFVELYTLDGLTMNLEAKDTNFEYLNCLNSVSYPGVIAKEFDPDSVPPLSSEYLRNFDGKYQTKGNYTLSVGAKIGISKDDSHYWNANVLSLEYSEGNYDMLLAHSSAKDASGSIDPGITGREQFITQQGLFWSHLRFESAPGSQWTVKWSSDWFDSPYEALQATLDKIDCFTGPSTTDISYNFQFYFGEPELGSDGWYKVNVGSKLGEYKFTSPVPVDMTWSEILSHISEVVAPEGKMIDYWWYSTNSITSIKTSYVYPLSSSYKPPLTNHIFYCALKDKPSGTCFIPEGTYDPTGTAYEGYQLVVNGATCTLKTPDGDKTFDVVPDMENNPNYQDFGGDYPNLRIFYNVTGKYRLKLYKTSRSSTTLLEWEK